MPSSSSSSSDSETDTAREKRRKIYVTGKVKDGRSAYAYRLMGGNVKAFICDKNFNDNDILLNAYVNMKAICETLHHIDNTFERNKRKIEIVSFWDHDFYWDNYSAFTGMHDTIKKYSEKWDAIATYVKTPEEWKAKEYEEFYEEVENEVYRKIDEEDQQSTKEVKL